MAPTYKEHDVHYAKDEAIHHIATTAPNPPARLARHILNLEPPTHFLPLPQLLNSCTRHARLWGFHSHKNLPRSIESIIPGLLALLADLGRKKAI